MIRQLSSAVWGGVPKGVYQEYGPTTVQGEPYSYRDKSLFHCGIDIGDLGIGWPLHAARAGQVVSVGWGQLGIQVGGEVDWYIHVDYSVVGVGQLVDRDQLVAYSGGKVPAGGVIYGAHLHFEVQTATPPTYNRPLTSVDPEAVLTRLYGADGNSLSGGFGTLTDQEIQERFVAVLGAITIAVPLPPRPARLSAYTDAQLDELIAQSSWADIERVYGKDSKDWLNLKAHPQTQGVAQAVLDLAKKVDGLTLPAPTPLNLQPVIDAIADLKAHPAVAQDPALTAAVQAISKHVGVGTP